MNKLVHEGETLKKILKSKGLGVTEVSEDLNVERRTVYNYFNSENLSNKVKQRFLDAYGIDINKYIHDLKYSESDPPSQASDPDAFMEEKIKQLQRKIDQLESAGIEKDKRISSLEEMLKLAIAGKLNSDEEE